ncbi:MAG TPA: LAGLIDADG family homing endonuclease, partial [Caldilineaceae bacterium]|nr:LAGLIDADG family homing endonuclease [Caldilineaceae bacterium]
EHIVATISLYRPGPIEYIPQFIRRLHGQEPVEFKHPKLEPILAETYGICVSGDALVTDVRSGRRYRLDELKDVDEFLIQGVDSNWQAATGRITRWIDSGFKPVFQVKLRNGAAIKVTGDHRLLTENGWQALNDLRVGDHIATPIQLFGPEQQAALPFDRRKLRILANLIADGSLASLASVDFVAKDQALIDAYVEALSAFPDVRPVFTQQLRAVIRIGVAKRAGSELHYHTPTSLLSWMRDLGLKHASGSRPGGLRSQEKFIPPFVFELAEDDIAFFLAALWDCDGYMGHKFCHYKTISQRLAEDVQTLLLRLGIPSTIHTATYKNAVRGESRCSYQVTIYDTKRLGAMLQSYMVTAKREIMCGGQIHRSIQREPFLSEVAAVSSLSTRALMQTYGIDRQHFNPRVRRRDRIAVHVVAPLAQVMPLPATLNKLGVDWIEIISIEPAGEEHVYDLTVEGLHSFVANNIIVHNCVYQEQIIQILSQLAGYAPGEADLVRRAVSKKKASDIEKHKKTFVAGCKNNGIDSEIASAIYGDIEFFARYGFNKSHAADYAVICVQTAFLKARYPVEYMAALLLVERDKTEKVTNFINEARR